MTKISKSSAVRRTADTAKAVGTGRVDRTAQGAGIEATDFADASVDRRILDELDYKIVTLLTGDARLSARAISRELGVAPGTILERIDRLETSGVITGYHAEVSMEALGYPVHVLVGVNVSGGGQSLENVIQSLIELKNVQTVRLITGEWTLLVALVLRDANELTSILVDTISVIPGVTATQTMLCLRDIRRPGSWSTG
ncbi:Lrp/AsnC family transcriptional regulator [Microbacterium trichothecenolyticum]|uniref:Lrp/AsnC family transcriptional regulator n=1 Tax=Microbacterium ureisolvens TaxID=2781186 RepID=A0ABS7HYH4_9MICO|nr:MULTISPECIES: Lrp/AsnC family transcriptional regulator [Microbacterium]MBW9110436.1 Lrp/AsnC family transcriptional regulator [Microbacterium ureisolvens]MBW9120541.1 Lrp/AsnC family transcriptional regulator [Microbacterium trichothecenolyticum]